MLFAAGFGTRMRHLTKDRPKPLVAVGGKALMDHTLSLAQAINPSRIVVNSHYHADQIVTHLTGTNVAISHESPGILETGGGVRNALPLLGDGPVFTANTDAIWQGPNPFEMLKKAWRPEDMGALLMCVPRDNAVGHTGTGDFTLDADGRLTRGPGQIYGGIQIMKTQGLHSIDQAAFSLNMVWNDMHASGTLFGLSYPGKWCDVGSPEGVLLAEKLLEGGDV